MPKCWMFHMNHVGVNRYIPTSYLFLIVWIRTLHEGGPRYKRGRYSDPGPRGRDHEQSTEEKLESLIMRVGEKVANL